MEDDSIDMEYDLKMTLSKDIEDDSIDMGYLVTHPQQATITMTKCVKPLRRLATSSTKSSKWSVLIGRAGTKSD